VADTPQLAVSFVHAPPALVGAPYPVRVVLETGGDAVVSGSLRLSCQPVDGSPCCAGPLSGA
jgi:hypothetical protein